MTGAVVVAIVPAAGLSSRMGRPKPLLLIEGRPLIARVVTALLEGGADRVLVVVPPPGRDEADAVAREAEAAGAEVVRPEVRPPDMRASVQAALASIAVIPAAILLTPADQPGIGAGLVGRVIEAGRASPGAIVVPRFGPKRGHPVWLPWAVAASIRGLPAGVGVNVLVDDPSRLVVEVAIDDPAVLLDLDTPDDYRRLTGLEPA